jgi:hypothetical protein
MYMIPNILSDLLEMWLLEPEGFAAQFVMSVA